MPTQGRNQAGPEDRASVSRFSSLHELLSFQARARPEAPAISAPGKKSLSYGKLFHQVEYVHEILRLAGLEKSARVAIVLPNSPEKAVALLGVMTSAVCAPLNPDSSAREFSFCFQDIGVNALLIQEGLDCPAVSAARSLGIPVYCLSPERTKVAGLFTLVAETSQDRAQSGYSQPQDLALLLHTSGTTARPKLVPLSQVNICFSAGNISSSLELKPSDRCLNVMPLFHVHGMIGGLISSLAAGASLLCPSGYQASSFFAWWEDFHPTWYTAVPTLHQSILSRAPGWDPVIRRHPPRFIRSCSAPLPLSLHEELEKKFQAPVVQAYGMTEASHQMACNPLPPKLRKPGSVGLPTGIRIAILDDAGGFLPPGGDGEIAIRGDSVTAGYMNNPEANTRSFVEGWFRTGDRGHFDEHGYLFITGRLKELINRGGEKIAPREIDEVLVSHPAVAQAAAFAIPDERLGEAVAAAVVLRPRSTVSEAEIRTYASQKLAHFKIPSRVVFLDEIPKGPTGKLQRIGLARALGLDDQTRQDLRPPTRAAEPRSEMEKQILAIFREVLGRLELDSSDHFFSAGGDSLDAARLLARVESQFGIQIPLGAFALEPTAGGLAAVIKAKKQKGVCPIVPVRTGGQLPPLFLVHPHDGQAMLYFKLVKYLDHDIPLLAFQAPDGQSLKPRPGRIEELAQCYVREMTARQPQGPFLIGGYCFGAWIAFEMARQLELQNRPVKFLALLDGYAPGYPLPRENLNIVQFRYYALLDRLRRIGPFLRYAHQLGADRKRAYLADLINTRFREVLSDSRRAWTAPGRSLFLPGREEDRFWEYHPGAYSGPVVVFCPSRVPHGFQKTPMLGWERYVRGRIKTIHIPGYHRSLIFEPSVRRLGRELTDCLKSAVQ